MITRRIIRAFVLAAVTAVVTLSSIAASFAQPAPVPALPDTERRTAYSITASNCACSVGFQLFGDSTDFSNWVEVWLNGVQVQFNDPVLGWTITSPTGPLGNIARPITNAVLTFANPQTGTVQIVGARRPRRVSQFSENTGVSARNLNQVITDIVAQNRETWDKINDVTGRAVLAAPGETLAVLPMLASRQNTGACFDSAGNLTSCVSVPSSTFAAGVGIAFTGTNPTTISSILTAGAGITITGSPGRTIALAPFLQTGAGSVPRILQDARKDIKTVADYGAIGYAPGAGIDCSSGAAAAPDDTAALTIAANQPNPAQLIPGTCYKITSTVVMTTSGGGLIGDRTSTAWMPAASFNSTTLCNTVNCFTSNAAGFFIQGQSAAPFDPIVNVTLSGFRIMSEVQDGRAVGAIIIRNAQNSFLTNLEIADFPVGTAVYADTLFNTHISGNYIHDFTTNLVWASPPQILAVTVDGTRVNGQGSSFNFYQNNNIQNIVFGPVTTAARTQQTVGLDVVTVGGIGNNVITGNAISNTGECIDNYSSNSVISGNTVVGCAQAGISVKHGGSNNIVQGNVIRASGQFGITVSGDVPGPSSGNLFDGNVIAGLDPQPVSVSMITVFRPTA